jgi:hypothetical protein
MSDEIYTDGIGEITVTGSVVRVDLMTMAVNDKDEEGRLKPAFKQRIIFPIEGFAHAAEAMLQMRQQLLDRGILTRKDETTPQMRFTESGQKGQPN